ncbi:DUF3108 domain-containing protein [Danxiaibacter flavus]|uniref:DUF3108 domain-containing protein n=1 Tax=Danxiaibacter flavus TaxID=3049108 RepID=A0ABV3ZJZ3_9BACT|nr:DUF3108 domain-containing protein [Chitinophagaceae bacterium DXS]
MKKAIYLLFILITYLPAPSFAQTEVVSNHAFQTGEKIRYDVFYNVIGIYLQAGTATFTASNEIIGNSEVYHVIGEGSTNSKYDWIFKVRDRYETYFNAADLKPLIFRRHINEGNYRKDEEISFNQQTNSVTTNGGVYAVPENIQDAISIMYYVRDINYDQYQTGSKIPVSVFIDNKVYKMYIYHNGREVIKTKYGEFNAIKLKPLLLKGNTSKDDEKLLEEDVFEGSEKMTIWITDDSNHIPVRIESPIAVGKVKIDLMQYENLKYSLTALKR